jgi:hypothetical protein
VGRRAGHGQRPGSTRAARAGPGVRVQARHAVVRTPVAIDMRARLGKAHCLGERAASSSARVWGRRPAVRRDASAPARGCSRRLAGATSRRGWSVAETIPTRQL